MNYLVFADGAAAIAYMKRIDGLFANSGAARLFLPYAPAVECVGPTQRQAVICAVGVDRVAIFSTAASVEGMSGKNPGSTSLAGPLIKAATDHLAAVKAATGAN